MCALITDVMITDLSAKSGEDFDDIWSLNEKDLWWMETGQHQKVINMPGDAENGNVFTRLHNSVMSEQDHHITSLQISLVHDIRSCQLH